MGKRSQTRAPGDDGERNLSPSLTTRSPSTEQRKSSASPPPEPPPPSVPRWLILDRIVHRSSRRRCGVIPNDATASLLAHDCVGRPVRASLRIADPPAVSRLYLHCTGRPAIEDLAEPKAIAAHGNAILFRMCVPFEDPTWWSSVGYFPVDYFVYSSSSTSSSSSPPALTLLPPCFDGGHTVDPKFDKYFQPYRSQQQRIMLDKEMGILCHGDDDEFFTVADLTQRFPREVDLCLLHHHHHPSPSASTAIAPLQWTVQRLKIPPDMKINLYTWKNDVVVPVDRRRLCWVDYYQGMLLIDVLTVTDRNNNINSHPPDDLLQFIPLPSLALKYRRPYMDGGVPDPFRCVSVTDDGIIIKLVCILLTKPPYPYPFTITTWILENLHRGGEWRKDVDTMMGDDEFFGMFGTDDGQSFLLPRVQPRFPMVSLVDPDVIFFLLEDEHRSLFWTVAVDMRDKKMLSSAVYINEEEEEDGYPSNRGIRTIFVGHPFIASKFSCYLSEDAITSRELSEKMQKSKESRVMQRSALEAELK